VPAGVLHQRLGPDQGRRGHRDRLPGRRGLARELHHQAATGSGKRLDLVAFGAENATHVDALAERLAAAGIPLVGEPGPVGTLGGGYGFRFFDIDGRTVEISSDVEARAHRQIEERESIPVRLSHVVLNSTDIDRTRRFYEEHLDFALSDTLGDVMHFMRCNPRHHSLAFARGPHVALHHVSFELRGIDEYMRGTGRVLRSGTKKVWGHRSGAVPGPARISRLRRPGWAVNRMAQADPG
jgi:catechol 2,3-dioxygenase-like lactoylglutathione lyase family enzyme